ncbi:MAG: twin-arginine translocation signal domain-containing protein [Chloroflexi bacterium]|nr:twin-arginine translocation signal domain-containing protein [Chloroflexota bacterium]
MATLPRTPVSRRRLLQGLGAAGVGLATATFSSAVRPLEALASPAHIQFGLEPFDRVLTTLGENGYSVRAAGLAVTDESSILIDGTDRTRRVLYHYADRAGPFMDYLGELATARAEGREFSYNGLLRAREELRVFTLPIPQPRFYGLPRVWQVDERFGFAVLPDWAVGPWRGRPWPLAGDFWGLVYVLDPQRTPWVWLIASTAEYRAVSPYGHGFAVRNEVVVQRAGPPQWLEYRAERAILAVPLRRADRDYFRYPTWL